MRGKFLFVGAEKLYLRGVTYGGFRPAADGFEFPDPDIVERDFAQMAASGLNAVRTYTVPPRWLLDLAERHGLRVMIGLPWEQHVTFLDDPGRPAEIEARVRAGVRACAGHPAVLAFAIGNEIPAGIVRWHGAARVQRFLRRLFQAVKAEDPEALVTYVNFPSTEYLELPFLDFVCFNVYLEAQEQFEAYLARLQNLADDRPLVMAEIGLDSQRQGTDTQARVLDWQIRTSFAAGCAGAFAFAWTDEWHRGGYDVEDWDFGLVDRQRRPKPALAAVRAAFAEVPFSTERAWPRISVVVCSYNGERTIRDCLEGLAGLAYPDYEVIVVDDGSTDRTAELTRKYDVRLIRTQNRGLSSARNTGLEAATGEIVAYIDDDAYPDPHWLHYLADTFMRTDFVGVGGPNLPPAGDGLIAACVANAPGGPIHVLLDDRTAEHIPGCNMAVRRAALLEIGGFDPRFRAAGDDVDLCWRLRERGWSVGFNPGAVVWHHRRTSVRAYWKQQVGYGRAEALLEEKWPEKYNSVGHISWSGRLYGRGITLPLLRSGGRVYQGRWGRAPFQSVYQPAPGVLASLPLMPEWYLLIMALAGLSALGTLWQPLLLFLPIFGLALAAPLVQAWLSARDATFEGGPWAECWRLRVLTALLHLLQPLARLRGRLIHGLTPWRQRGSSGIARLGPRTVSVWSESWRSAETWLGALEVGLKQQGAVVLRGGDFDGWDLEVRGGLFGAARVLLAIEEHGGGKQLTRFRLWPKVKIRTLVLASPLTLLAVAAGFDGAELASLALATGAVLLLGRTLLELHSAGRAVERAIVNLDDFGHSQVSRSR